MDLSLLFYILFLKNVFLKMTENTHMKRVFPDKFPIARKEWYRLIIDEKWMFAISAFARINKLDHL